MHGFQTFIRNNRGSALVEFAIVLPFLLLITLGLADVCMLLDEQLALVHLGREAANVLSRGANFQETFGAITVADGALELDGEYGLVILTRIGLDQNGQPVIVEQQALGGLTVSSAVGTLSMGPGVAPATIPNGRTLPNNMSLVVVELFSSQSHFLGSAGLAPGSGNIVLTSLAAF